jgi:hypothetical protein
MNAEAKTDPLSIRVAINTGHKTKVTNIKPIEDAIDGYNWIVNNTEYVIDTYHINIIDIRDGKLTTDNYDVHIIDGVSDEFFGCFRIPFNKSDDDLRSYLDNFITSGGGYIGRCGGALLAATYDEEKPETEYEYYVIQQNEFLGENSPKIMMHSKVGVPIYSQFLEMNYNRIIKRPSKPRIPWDPGALGVSAYIYYQPQSSESPNYKYSLSGICHNITIKNRLYLHI